MHVVRIAILGLLAMTAYGQMTPQYSSYTSWTTDGVKIYQTVLIDGQTVGSCTYTYPCNCDQYGCHAQCTGTYANCVGATHTPKINNVLDGIGGWSTGSGQAPFTHMSYQTTVSAPVAAGQLLSSQTEGQVICSGIGMLLDTVVTTAIGQAPSCGGSSATVLVNIWKETAKCDYSTINQARVAVGGSAYSYIKKITATTSTDNTLLLDLLNQQPFHDDVCSTASSNCWTQNYKAAVPTQYTGKTGHIIWHMKIFCSTTSPVPDLNGDLAQTINCP
jgi:hypothetical protein